MVSVHVRPLKVEDCVMLIHWAGDFILKGAANQSPLGVLVERTSGLTLLAKIADATATSALAGVSSELNSIAAPMHRSMTCAKAKDLSRRRGLTTRTGVAVYFCAPHSTCQGGTYENHNGLLRQYLPKGTDLSVFSQANLDGISDSLNNRTRATHSWLVPLQVFSQVVAGAHQAPTSVQQPQCWASVLKPPVPPRNSGLNYGHPQYLIHNETLGKY